MLFTFCLFSKGFIISSIVFRGANVIYNIDINPVSVIFQIFTSYKFPGTILVKQQDSIDQEVKKLGSSLVKSV